MVGIAPPSLVARRYINEALKARGITPKSIGKWVHGVRSYWEWLQPNNHVPEDSKDPWDNPQAVAERRDGHADADHA